MGFQFMNTFQEIVSSALPFVGSLIGGPLGAQAGSLVSRLITGKDGSTEDEIKNSLATLSPDKLIELKKIDAEYQSNLLKYNFDTQKAFLEDVENARNLQQKAYEHPLSKRAPVADLVLSRVPPIISYISLSALVVIIILLFYFV